MCADLALLAADPILCTHMSSIVDSYMIKLGTCENVLTIILEVFSKVDKVVENWLISYKDCSSLTINQFLSAIQFAH